MFVDHSDIDSVYLHVAPIDFRKGINGLGAIVNHEFKGSDGGCNLFVFVNRKKDKVKVLYWDRTGFALWQKALEQDRFKWPRSSKAELEISSQDLDFLLSGYNIVQQTPHQNISPTAFY